MHQFWKLASSYRNGMNDFIRKRRTTRQDFLTGELLGVDEEKISTFNGLSIYQNSGFLVLNLGVFEPKTT